METTNTQQDTCKICKTHPAIYPVYATPDMCEECSDAAWAKVAAHAATLPAQPGNDITNVWE